MMMIGFAQQNPYEWLYWSG